MKEETMREKIKKLPRKEIEYEIYHCWKEQNDYALEQQKLKETIDLQRQVIENILNDVATYCWQNQTNYIDPQELSYWVEEKRKEIKPLLEELGYEI